MKSIEEQIAEAVTAKLLPEIRQMRTAMSQEFEQKLKEATGNVLMTETEAEEYTGYSRQTLKSYRDKDILNNYGERKFIKYLKRELDALLQIKKRA